MGTPVHGCESWATAMGLLRVDMGRARKEVKRGVTVWPGF